MVTLEQKSFVKENEDDKEDIIDPISKIRFFSIKRITDIMAFVNIIQTKKLENNTDLIKSLMAISQDEVFEDDEKVREEYINKLKENTILLVGNKFFPMSFDFINKDASQIQLKFVECLIVACRLSDLAEEKGKFKDENKKFNLGSFMGAIIDFIHRVDVIKNKLISSSTDETHLLKNCMEIYSSGSKLISLEESIKGKVKEKKISDALDIERYVVSLGDDERSFAIQTLLVNHFKPKWIKGLEKERIQKILNLILKEEQFPITVSPNMLNDLYLKLTKSNKNNFISYISKHLTPTEKQLLLGGKVS